jgi:flagellar basal-body rod modification protein FlgD
MSGSVSNTGTTSPTAAAAATAAAGGTTGLGIGASFNTFLTLLTTQLKNQDPTNAMDTNAMTQQLVSFASVEQQISMNTSLQTLIGLQQTNEMTSAAPLMGKPIEVASSQIPLQNGTGTLRLPAAGSATTADITITDKAGQVIRTATVNLGSSSTDWVWNGKATSGTQQPDGAYNVAVAGRDASNSPQSITATVVGTATSASVQPVSPGSASNTLMLNLGPVAVPFTAVRSVGG